MKIISDVMSFDSHTLITDSGLNVGLFLRESMWISIKAIYKNPQILNLFPEIFTNIVGT